MFKLPLSTCQSSVEYRSRKSKMLMRSKKIKRKNSKRAKEKALERLNNGRLYRFILKYQTIISQVIVHTGWKYLSNNF